jgi:hypothetical protein
MGRQQLLLRQELTPPLLELDMSILSQVAENHEHYLPQILYY